VLDPRLYRAALAPILFALILAAFSLEDTQPDWALAYRWDIVLRGPAPTPFEEAH